MMTALTPEDPSAALREEIRRAGAVTRRLRRGLLVILGVLILGLFANGVVNYVTGNLDRQAPVRVDHPNGDYTVTFVRAHPPGLLAILSTLEFLIALALAGSVALAYRAMRQRQLHRRLRTLGATAAAQVLLPLRTAETADARKIANNLMRRLNIPTEVTPAGTPGGSGAEVSGES